MQTRLMWSPLLKTVHAFQSRCRAANANALGVARPLHPPSAYERTHVFLFSGNIIAQLAVKKPSVPFRTLAEVVESKNYVLSTLAGGSVEDLFKAIIYFINSS